MAAEPDRPGQVLHLPLNVIRPNPAQPRERFDESALDELAASVREHGVLQPVLVRSIDENLYELIAGERRWQAALRAGLSTIPALPLEVSPRRALELALVENLQRSDLSPLEEAEAFRCLIETLGLTQEQLAERLAISRPAVSNRLRLLALAPEVRRMLADGRISEGHARALLPLADDRQIEAARLVTAGHLTVRQTERLVQRMASRSPRPRHEAHDGAIEGLAVSLRHALGTRVSVRPRGGGVSVLIHFHSTDAAFRLVEALDPDAYDDI